MTPDTMESGTILVCDGGGTILRVIRDGLGITTDLAPGQVLIRLVDPANFKKVLSFLVALKERGAASGWELNAPVAGQVTSLHFAGMVIDSELMVCISKTSTGVQRLYEDILRINNEQTTTLRAVIKEKAELIRTQTARDSALYDEVSRLNNELVNLQRELAKKNVELEKLNALKNQFLGIAAHDLRSPLSHVLTYSDFLLDEAGKALNEEHREFLAIIRSSSEFMLQLVNNLLDVAKIESGRLELHLQPMDLIALVKRNVGLNRVLAAKKGIAIAFNHDDSPIEVLADAERLEQVLNNLLGNAIKFSPPDSTIEVRIVRRDESAVISVQDRGAGIPEEEKHKLFQPFTRTSVKGTGGEKGTGLGLAIVKKIVVEHQGEVWVESAPGLGSTFCLSLPLGQKAGIAQ